MANIDIILPAMGEGIIEATIIKLLVKSGDKVSEDDILIEIATDKVDSEITSPQDGTIGEILFKEDDLVKVGQTILYLGDGKNEIIADKKKEQIEIKEEPKKIIETETIKINIEENINTEEVVKQTESGKFISPLVRNIAKQENISNNELNNIVGTGDNGRLTKRDILQYLENKKSGNNIEIIEEPKQEVIKEKKTEFKPVIEQTSKHEIIKMDRVRKLISDHMLNSIKTSAHVSSFVEADMTNIVNWRNKIKNDFLKKEGEKITFTPIFIEVVAKAIKDFPMINVSIDGDNIIKKKNINIGMATALPNGNLIVPVIKNANKFNLTDLAKSVNDLANRARENNLRPEEIQDGTFTITNFGTFNNIFGTPIINQPQVAILGIGAIKKQVSVIETEAGDTIGIRSKMILSLSYDHRVIDGALGGMFLAKIGEYLENYIPQIYN
jgi:2-oxoglutarate dehydrogenase E2 component (dihydrolipoamide succinyltransferase)